MHLRSGLGLGESLVWSGLSADTTHRPGVGAALFQVDLPRGMRPTEDWADVQVTILSLHSAKSPVDGALPLLLARAQKAPSVHFSVRWAWRTMLVGGLHGRVCEGLLAPSHFRESSWGEQKPASGPALLEAAARLTHTWTVSGDRVGMAQKTPTRTQLLVPNAVLPSENPEVL